MQDLLGLNVAEVDCRLTAADDLLEIGLSLGGFPPGDSPSAGLKDAYLNLL